MNSVLKQLDGLTERQALLLVTGLALVLRLINVVLMSARPDLTFLEDAKIYWATASNIADLGGFYRTIIDGTLIPETERMPLYPYMILGIRAVFGDVPTAVLLSQAVLDTATCAIMFKMGVTYSRRAGVFAGLAAALCPGMIIFSGLLLTETVFLFFLTLAVYLGLKHLRTFHFRDALFAGLCFGLALATRSVLYPLLFCIPVCFVLIAAFQSKWREGVLGGLAFLVAGSLCIAPLLVRNATVYDSYSLTAQTGQHMLYWVAPVVIAKAEGTPRERAIADLRAIYEQNYSERTVDGIEQKFEISANKTELAFAEMSKTGVGTIVQAWLEGAIVNLSAPSIMVDPRVRELVSGSFYDQAGGTKEKILSFLGHQKNLLYFALVAASALTLLLVNLLGAYGLITLFKRDAVTAGLLTALILYFLLVTGPVMSPKYRLPVDPLLLLLFAVGLDRILSVTRFFRPAGDPN
ncbi:hypothetical protein EOI86_16385 [Hwanghaeella grinnelliae]|uniref:Glycosyltransferase RgtA/B/C/D-like domain-containing protein n=1 Tax=Hwanghaeella grinnelliae TaxID=2500179 RepID=A0A437QQF2_9PROT|nr:glycosyltransferase family 39 protein [Hwanghaeella grinnelliae]RVU36742.1 hypothetical protein EOI86_16385 [Hwanghaeella grinnelliae]